MKREVAALVHRAESSSLNEAEALELFELRISEVDLALAENLHTPLAVVQKLSLSNNISVLGKLIPRDDLEESLVIKLWKERKHGALMEAFLLRKRLPEEVLWGIFEISGKPKVKVYGVSPAAQLAGRDDLPEDILVNLSFDERPSVAEAAGRNPKLPMPRMIELATHWNSKYRALVVRNPKLPEEYMDLLARDEVAGIRADLAENVALPYEVQHRLALDSYPSVVLRLLANPKVDRRIEWEITSLPKGNIDGRDDYQRAVMATAEKRGDLEMLTWARRTGKGFGFAEDGGLRRTWQGVTQLITGIDGERLKNCRSMIPMHSIKVIGWWEPGWEEKGEEKWIVVAQDKASSPLRKQHARFGWLRTRPGFDGVMLPLELGEAASDIAGVIDTGATLYNGDCFYLGRSTVTTTEGGVEIITPLMEIVRGETPDLPNLQQSYSPIEGPYRAKGLLLTEEHALYVLWSSREGVEAGWESVANWEEAKNKEALGVGRPQPMAPFGRNWEEMEASVREAYSGQEI